MSILTVCHFQVQSSAILCFTLFGHWVLFSIYILSGYSCQKDFSGFLVTTYKKHKNVSDFLGAMDSVFKDLTAVVDKREKSGTK